jgi:hypothetical protein
MKTLYLLGSGELYQALMLPGHNVKHLCMALSMIVLVPGNLVKFKNVNDPSLYLVVQII